MKNKEIDWAREEALRRFSLIAPLLEEAMPGIEKARRRAILLSERDVSERTLRRWFAAYRTGGFDALIPKERKDKGTCKAIAPEILAMAEECPRLLKNSMTISDLGFLKPTTTSRTARSVVKPQPKPLHWILLPYGSTAWRRYRMPSCGRRRGR